MTRTAPLTPILAISFLYSLGTAVLWNGLGFIAKETYGFSESANLALAIYNGGVYAIAAFGCGRFLRAIESVLSPRGTLIVALLLQGFIAPIIVIFDGAWTIWLISIVFSLCSALLWPRT